MSSGKPKFKSSCFRDGERKIDFILVYSTDLVQKIQEHQMLQKYLEKLQNLGLQTETEAGTVETKYMFVKIHVPLKIINETAKKFNVELSCNNPYYKTEAKCTFKWLSSIVVTPSMDDAVFERAKESLAGKQPTEATDSERIIICHRLMKEASASVGGAASEFTLADLLQKKIVTSVYPIHETPSAWPTTGPISDRQLLRKYWVRLRAMFKEQPLNMIENYYGPEVAFYFAWIGFYTRMLVSATIISLIFLIFAVIYLAYNMHLIRVEVCNSDMVICPTCADIKYCPFTYLHSHCLMAMVNIILENPLMSIYAIIMCFWGVLFVTLWKRREAMLRLRWNLFSVQVDRSMRKQFIDIGPQSRMSSITNAVEYYIPPSKKIRRMLLSHFYLFLMMLLFLGIVVLLIIGRKMIEYGCQNSASETVRRNVEIIVCVSMCIMVAIVIEIFSTGYCYVARKLCDLEAPRTNLQYESTYNVKTFVLAFANNFFYLTYVTFFKGRFQKEPAVRPSFLLLDGLASDNWSPTDCLAQISILVLTIAFFRRMSVHTKYLLLYSPPATVLVRKTKEVLNKWSKDMPQWERDFQRKQLPEDYLSYMYCSAMTHYTIVACFLAGFPLLPFIALINNLLEMRNNAHSLLIASRRYIPRQVAGMGSWNNILKSITLMGAISNPIILTLNNNFIGKIIYKSQHGTMRGFVKSRFSEFPVANFQNVPARFANVTHCHYSGIRFPPGHHRQYQLTGEYWYELCIKSLFFICLENTTLLVSLFLSHVIPEVPRKVKLRLEHEQQQLKEYRQATRS